MLGVNAQAVGRSSGEGRQGFCRHLATWPRDGAGLCLRLPSLVLMQDLSRRARLGCSPGFSSACRPARSRHFRAPCGKARNILEPRLPLLDLMAAAGGSAAAAAPADAASPAARRAVDGTAARTRGSGITQTIQELKQQGR